MNLESNQRKPFAPILTPDQRAAIAAAPVALSDRALGRQYGVSRHTIAFWRKPERRASIKANRRARAEIAKFLNSSKMRTGMRKRIKLNKYEQMIRDAVKSGIGVDELEQKIDENLSALTQERFAIDVKIRECKEAQKALFNYLDIKPDYVPEVIEALKADEYIGADEFRMLMGDAGLSSRALSKATGGKYSERAISSYRLGQVVVPRPLADLLRGYPKKQIMDAWG